MATDAPDSVRVQCASCGGRFRIRRRPGGTLPDHIRCPSCESIIGLADEAGPSGWVASRERRDTETTRSHSRSQSRPPDHGDRKRPSDNDHDPWDFQSAQDARQSSSSIFAGDDTDRRDSATDQTGTPAQSTRPTGDGPSPNRRDREGSEFESGPSRIEKLENVDQSDPDSVMTPLPANSIIEDEPDVHADQRRSTAAETSPAGGDSTSSPRHAPTDNTTQQDRPPTAAEIAHGEAYPETDPASGTADEQVEEANTDQSPASEDEPRTPNDADADPETTTPSDAPAPDEPKNFNWEAGEQLFIRVDEGTERKVDRNELLELLREGVWTDAVEVRPANASTWVPLRRHPVWDDIRDEMVGHSRQIMLEGPGAPDVESESDDDSEPDDESESEAESESSQPFNLQQQPEAPAPGQSSGATDRNSTSDRTPAESSDEIDAASDSSEPASTDTADSEDVQWYRSAFLALLVLLSILAVAMTVLLIWVTDVGGLGSSIGLWDAESKARAVEPDETASETGEPSVGTTDRTAADAGGERTPGGTAAPEANTDGTGALTLAGRSIDRALDPVNIARGLLDRNRPQAARWHALNVLARGELADHAPGHPSPRQLERARQVYRDAIDDDQSLRQSVVTIGKDVQPQKLHALGGGWSVTFRFTRHGQSRWAFKPAQTDWEEGWKAEIAAWRFCEVVACRFRIPKNRPARISKTHFERLYGRVDDRDQKAYRERFDALIWREEKDDSGETREYLYGTLKEWIPSFAKWPIEYKSTWRPWLSASTDPKTLDRPVDESLQPLRDKISDAWWNRIEEQLDGATTRELAAQISDLMVFDYVTTNWDRFSNFEEYYGVNNQFADGQFVSIDNGAAFAYNNFGEVMARFSEVQRYSRRTIASLRALNREVMNPVLFPDASERGKKRLKRVWNQRSRLLERIADLKSEHGADAVMTFE